MTHFCRFVETCVFVCWIPCSIRVRWPAIFSRLPSRGFQGNPQSQHHRDPSPRVEVPCNVRMIGRRAGIGRHCCHRGGHSALLALLGRRPRRVAGDDRKTTSHLIWCPAVGDIVEATAVPPTF
ncbi:hypothetical protein GQ607_001556 [Colletotrichum asianum]|uniref:Uncharacterized protein n=1 Tax=Colletotrichum asianum TaxID=702518 RepID=A0A8H3WUI7_9PEZI|nr:hypothetical protein GQ607_001556 [Colletotrichum asianum]